MGSVSFFFWQNGDSYFITDQRRSFAFSENTSCPAFICGFAAADIIKSTGGFYDKTFRFGKVFFVYFDFCFGSVFFVLQNLASEISGIIRYHHGGLFRKVYGICTVKASVIIDAQSSDSFAENTDFPVFHFGRNYFFFSKSGTVERSAHGYIRRNIGKRNHKFNGVHFRFFFHNDNKVDGGSVFDLSSGSDALVKNSGAFFVAVNSS